MLATRFTELVGCTVPLQLAAMGGIGTPELAAAVSGAGGLGMLPAMGPKPLADLWPLATRSGGRVGVNFLGPFTRPEDVEAAAALAPLIEVFFAEPDAALVQRAKSGRALVSWQVGSATEARAAQDAGCDLVVAQGVEAGGHVRGSIAILPLLDAVLGAVQIPVVAAGGIATGRGMAAVLAAGADAARVGTRFAVATESAAHPDYVAALLQASEHDTELTTIFAVGWPNAPHRVLRSSIRAVEELQPDEPVGETTAFGTPAPVPARSSMPPTAGTTGRIDAMALYAGQSVGAVTARQGAADIVRELSEGAESLLRARGRGQGQSQGQS